MRRYVILENRTASRAARGEGQPALAPWSLPPVAAETTVSTERLPTRAVRELRRDPRIAHVSPVMPTTLVAPVASAIDVGNASSWGVRAIGADTTTWTGEGTIVAVLDTGIDITHPAFSDVQISRQNFSNSGDGDIHGHGTHCAGTIFGRDIGGLQIGAARGVTRALSAKILDDSGKGDTAMLFRGIQWAVDGCADVINMSLGFDFPGLVDELVQSGWPVALSTSIALEAYRENLRMLDAMMTMLRARAPSASDAVVIAATGNESKRGIDPNYRIAASLPAAGLDVLAVAALQAGPKGLKVADFSNTGAALSGPGVAIPSAAAGGGLKIMSGTSMACPHVAAAAALWWECVRASGLRSTAEIVRAKLLASAVTEGLSAGFDHDDVGAGLVRAP